METLVERGCGLDVHQATVVACLLIVRKDGKVQKQVRTFGTTTRELLSMREWLLSQGCTHVAMESTGVYWKPVYAILEGAFRTAPPEFCSAQTHPRTARFDPLSAQARGKPIGRAQPLAESTGDSQHQAGQRGH